MELPDLGKQCNEPTCRQLDFLPVKCDACKKIFCSEHYKYETHNCPLAYQKNVQVPVCPLCNAPVPGKADELPDIRVSRHIDSECQSDRAVTQRKKVYANRCSAKGCKQKEMIPLVCDDCGLNYCLKHRLKPDHACRAPPGSKPLNPSARAALNRFSSSSTSAQAQKSSTMVNGYSSGKLSATPAHLPPMYNQAKIQGNLSEDDALQLALQASMGESSSGSRGSSRPSSATKSTEQLTQEQADFLLAQAIADSEQEARSPNNEQVRSRSHSNKSCQLT